ncbi:hypothetical protein [Priestia megaterium]|uniref:hypothetical protein n=1 Tax=Priestia megaterium TaxID=1404 RepID=UPI003CC6529D
MDIADVLFYKTVNRNFFPNTKEEIALIKEAVVVESNTGLCFRNCDLEEYTKEGLEEYINKQTPLLMKINDGAAVSVIIKKKWLEAWMGYNIDVEIIG